VTINLHISRIRRSICRSILHTLLLKTMRTVIITTVLPEIRTKPGIWLEPNCFPAKAKSVAIKL
jgi:hypothetical protein